MAVCLTISDSELVDLTFNRQTGPKEDLNVVEHTEHLSNRKLRSVTQRSSLLGPAAKYLRSRSRLLETKSFFDEPTGQKRAIHRYM
jgi:hypothetical protein